MRVTRSLLSLFRLSKDGGIGKLRWRSRWESEWGATHAYLGARGFAAQVVESGRRVTAHSKTESACAGFRRKRERVNAVRLGQAAVSSSSRRAWKARLPILRAMVSRATVVSRRWRV